MCRAARVIAGPSIKGSRFAFWEARGADPAPGCCAGPVEEVGALVDMEERVQDGCVQILGRQALGVAVLGAVALAGDARVVPVPVAVAHSRRADEVLAAAGADALFGDLSARRAEGVLEEGLAHVDRVAQQAEPGLAVADHTDSGGLQSQASPSSSKCWCHGPEATPGGGATAAAPA